MKVNILSIFGIILCATGFSQAFVAPRQTFKSYSTPQLHKTQHVTRLQMWGGDGDKIEGTDRALACLPYLLPILDGDHFGNYIFQRAPPLGILNAILVGPLETVYHSIPFLGLVCFFGLSFLSRNPNFSQPVRFNMQQAILIDIALIFPDLIGSATGSMHLPRLLVEPATNFVFYTFSAMILYSLYSNLTGKKPNQIPWISEAAEMSVGPF